MVFFMERRYNLLTRPGSSRELYGTYTAITHGRLYRNLTGACRMQGQASTAPIFATVRTWQVAGFSTGSDARLQGTFDICAGDNCDDPNLLRSGFIFNLHLEDGTLTDRDEASPAQVRATLHRDAWHQERQQEAITALAGIVSILQTGTREDVRSRLAPGFGDADQVNEFLTSLPIVRTQNRGVASRETMDAHVMAAPASAAAVVPGPVPDQIGVIMQQVNGVDGTKWLEIAFLQRIEGVWKLWGLSR